MHIYVCILRFQRYVIYCVRVYIIPTYTLQPPGTHHHYRYVLPLWPYHGYPKTKNTGVYYFHTNTSIEGGAGMIHPQTGNSRHHCTDTMYINTITHHKGNQLLCTCSLTCAAAREEKAREWRAGVEWVGSAKLE